VQTVQYIQPQHHAKLSAAELLVIDEAAAIPLPLVKAMLGPYLVFLCSTVNGYEGGLPDIHFHTVTLHVSLCFCSPRRCWAPSWCSAAPLSTATRVLRHWLVLIARASELLNTR